MAKVMKRRWAGEQESGPSRRDRRSCEYEVYIPDRLVGRTIALDGPVAADVVEAETAITRLNLQARALSNSEALARMLLRSESVASSKIEGLEVGARRLLGLKRRETWVKRPPMSRPVKCWATSTP